VPELALIIIGMTVLGAVAFEAMKQSFQMPV
jgi:hypothetical protein